MPPPLTRLTRQALVLLYKLTACMRGILYMQLHYAGWADHTQCLLAPAAHKALTLVCMVTLTPAASHFLCLGTVKASGCSGPSERVSFTRPASSTAAWRGQTGSTTRLLIVHSCTSRHMMNGSAGRLQ